jgi:hypothetical protein
MKKHNIKQAKSCSKYSLWVVYSGLTEKYDTFQETMEKIKEIRLDVIKDRARDAIWLTKDKTPQTINNPFTTKKLAY